MPSLAMPRIYLHFESPSAPAHTMKLKLSMGMTVRSALEAYQAGYRTKHPQRADAALPDYLALKLASGGALPLTTRVEDLPDKADCYVIEGSSKTGLPRAKAEAADPGTVRARARV